MLRCVISNLEYRFYKAYNMEFEDKRTVYSECAFRLIPREDEPSVCLMHGLDLSSYGVKWGEL